MGDSPRRREHGSGLFPSSRPRGRSQSRSPPTVRRSRSPLRGRDRVNASNPGNTLYVTGLSSRVTEKDLDMHFSKEGKVVECYLIVEPRTRASRGFAFVTMNNVEDAERCIKYLNHSVMEGRYITVEKLHTLAEHNYLNKEHVRNCLVLFPFQSKRKRARTPTPGNYLGLKKNPDTIRYDRGRHHGGYRHDDYEYRASPRHSPYRVIRDYSPRRSPYGAGRSRRERSRSYSPARM